MKLTCPACNALFTLDAALQGEHAREAVLTALQLPAPLARPLLRYLACFAPAKRQLSWDRVASILGELRPMIEAAQITRAGRTWAAPQDYWLMAFDIVQQAREAGKLTLPLRGHGYLLQVIAGLSNRAEALAEQADHNRRAGISSNSVTATHASHAVVAPSAAPVERVPMPEAAKQWVKRRPTGESHD